MKIKVPKRRKDGIWQRYWIVSLANSLKKGLMPFSKKVEICGSIRRQKDEINDIDLVVIPKESKKDDIKRFMERRGDVIASGDDILRARVKKVPVDIFYTEPKSFGAALYTYTGPGMSNVGRRTFAANKGLLLNEKGLFERKMIKGKAVAGKYIAGRTEKDVYKALGRPYKKPEDRG